MAASEIAAAPLPEDDYNATTDEDNAWERLFGPDDDLRGELATTISSDEGGATPVADEGLAKKVTLCVVIMYSTWFSCESSVVSFDELWWLCES